MIGASVDEPGEGSLVFVVAVADDFAVALVGDTALVGAVPGLANDLRYGDGNFGEGVVGAHQLIIAYRAGLRLVAGHRRVGVRDVFLMHKNTYIYIKYSAPY